MTKLPRAVIFDLDGTLIEAYLDRPDKDYHAVTVLPGRRERLIQLQKDGVQLAIVTNQGGVAFGYNTLGEFEVKIQSALAKLGLSMSTPVTVCYSDVRGKPPFNTVVDAARRKPSGAMIDEVLVGLKIHPSDALFVGDRPEDEQAAANAGVAFMWAHEFFGD